MGAHDVMPMPTINPATPAAMPASLVGSSFNPFRTPGTKPPYECATMKRFASSFEAIRINGINTMVKRCQRVTVKGFRKLQL